MPARTKFTEEIGRKIVASIRKGRPKWVAAERVGIHRETFDEWIKRGEVKRAEGEDTPESERPFEDFAQRVRRAAALFVCDELDRIDREFGKSKGDWNRMRWKLRQLFPREFADAQVLEHHGPDGGAIKHQHAHDVSSHDLLAALDAFARGRATDGDGPADAGTSDREPEPGAEGDPRA